MMEPDTRPELSLVYPVFDEADNIGALLDQSLRLAPKLSSDFEIIVVDDGSRDGSARIIEERRRTEPRIRVVRHAANRGYGAALHAGLREARGEFVFFSDADLQFDLEELSTLLAHAREFDIVAGYRLHRRDPWPRRIIGWSWSALVRALFDLRVRDIDCAFKVFRRHVIDAIPIESIGAFINTEILVRADKAHFRIHQVPVTHRRRRHGRQSGANPSVMLRALVELAMLYGELRRPRSDFAASHDGG
ncbi:MAG: glycosyltransferase family 2 protein [Deltaproteobacteria bacterium]|nr:glycosyltransferase family 2 protein [Deltaproteobacteria bacterium]